jgi:hypothetical protein
MLWLCSGIIYYSDIYTRIWLNIFSASAAEISNWLASQWEPEGAAAW